VLFENLARKGQPCLRYDIWKGSKTLELEMGKNAETKKRKLKFPWNDGPY